MKPNHCNDVLNMLKIARDAIVSLPDDALGYETAEQQALFYTELIKYPAKEELLSAINSTISQAEETFFARNIVSTKEITVRETRSSGWTTRQMVDRYYAIKLACGHEVYCWAAHNIGDTLSCPSCSATTNKPDA